MGHRGAWVVTGLDNGLRVRWTRISQRLWVLWSGICSHLRGRSSLPSARLQRWAATVTHPLYLTLASGALKTCGCDVSLHFEPQAVTAEDTVNMIQTLSDHTPSEFLGTVNREIKGRGLHRVALNTPCKLAGSGSVAKAYSFWNICCQVHDAFSLAVCHTPELTNGCLLSL